MKPRMPVLFGQNHPMAAFRQQSRGRCPGGTAANDEDITCHGIKLFQMQDALPFAGG
jgi:hypothetical protein